MAYIKSPLNYTGGKYKLLPDLFDIFPEQIDTFVDLFAGGFNVGINVNANCIVCNDQINYLIDMYQYFEATPFETLISEIELRIKEFSLSKNNADGYNLLRERYNREKDIIDLFVLTCYSFNHQIRFNNSQKFNTPFGKERSSFNPSIEKNLYNFCNALKTKNIVFSNDSFENVDLSKLGPNSFLYCDPPYLISTGSYNDGNRGFKDWTEVEEKKLLELLDRINAQGTKFALSNVLYHKGLTNELLIEWSKNYQVYYLDKTYANCSYQFKEKNAKTVEVVITNFKSERYSQCQQLSLF